MSLVAANAGVAGAPEPSAAPAPTRAPAPAVSPLTEIRLPVPEVERLPNGLEVVWFLSDSLPVIDIALLVKSGYRDDPPGKTGVSELVSSTLERGAAGMTAQQIARAIEVLGASRYASGDDDTFTVGVHGLASDASALLDLLSKIATKPDFAEAEVRREHARILDRWNHIADSGDTLAGLAYNRLLAAGTSYGRGSFLSVSEFQRVGRADVVAWHQAHFTPKNSILMVVGRAKRQDFRPKIEAAFGAWKGEAPRRHWVDFADSRLTKGKGAPKGGQGPVIHLVGRENLTQAQIRMGFRAPLIDSPRHYPLVVANTLLGEYFHSRLNTIIRDQLGLTYGIGSSFSYSKDLGRFTIGSATRNEAVGQVIRKTIEILQALKKEPVPADEVAMAKEYLVGGYPLGVSTLGAVASRWLAGYVFDLGPGYLNEFVPKISAVRPEDVQEAVRKDFDLDHLRIVVAGSEPEIRRSLEASGFHSIRRISLEDLR